MSNSKILVGFLAGAAVGSLLGVLFAPDKGTETRRKISEKTGDVTGALKDKFGDFVDGLKDTFASTKREAEDVAEKGIGKFNTLKADAKNALS
jgi:gas vesicle protein